MMKNSQEYFITLFVDTPGLVKEKLNGFMSADLSEAWLVSGQSESPLISLEENLPPNQLYLSDDCWYIHGLQRIETSKGDFPGMPMMWNVSIREQISLEKIDDALGWFATRYLWSVLPWGEPTSFSGFAFVSASGELRDRFVNVSSNYRTKMTLYFKYKGCYVESYSYPEPDYSSSHNWYDVNLLISNYHVKNNFSEVLQAILFQGDVIDLEKKESAAGRIWDACECDRRRPWIITFDFFEDDEGWEFPFQWEEAKFKFIQRLVVELIEHPDYPLPEEWATKIWGIYQPLDRASFMLMCNYQLSVPDTLLVVPHGTDLERLKSLLAKTEGDIYSYLCYIPDFLNLTDWFYGPDRSGSDFGSSLFVARDSDILRKIDGFNRDDGYRLISCF